MSQMAQYFGAAWPCLLLAGAWSLVCGWFLRHASAAPTEEAGAARLAAALDQAQRLEAEMSSKQSQIQALELDLVKQRHRVADVEATSAAELQMLTMKLASNGAKAAGFDQARETSLKAIEERERAVAVLTERLHAAESVMAESLAQAQAHQFAGAKAAADLAAAQNAWNIERATLVDEHRLKLAAQERAHAQALRGSGSAEAAQASRMEDMAQLEARADALATKLEASQAALRIKNDALGTLERRLMLLSPLPARVALAESELATLRRTLDERDATLARLSIDMYRSTEAGRRRDDLKLIEGIGPKIEMLLNDAGYLLFIDLADSTPEALAAVLERSGPRFALARTDTWPQQAQLLATGDIAGFRKLTDELKGGVRR